MYSFLIITVFFLLFYFIVSHFGLFLEKPENPEFKNDKIPKIIIQTWKDENIPQKYLPLIESVKSLNNEYTYLFFSDDDIESFMKKNYLEYYNTYQNLPIKIQKIDFFRYLAVYHYGGIYLDLDMQVNKNMDELLSNDIVFPVDEYINNYNKRIKRYGDFYDKNQHFLLGQYAFASVPKHPFLRTLIDDIHKNINKTIKNVNHNSENYVYSTTGPDFVTKKYMEFENKNSILILDNQKRQHFGDFAIHKYFGSWKKT
tara:strand:+ start:448 stop:1218 length:771 start_codon:yes stop_codon:yes gene_type:complete